MSQDDQVVLVRLRRNTTSTPWGFRMQGGHEFGSQLCIQQVNPKSLSHRQGLLVGDLILAIGSVQARNMNHEQVKMEIIRAGNDLDLLVLRRQAQSGVNSADSHHYKQQQLQQQQGSHGNEVHEEPTEYRGYTNPNVQSRSFRILQESLSYSEAHEDSMPPPSGKTPGESIVSRAYNEGKMRLEELSEINPRNFTNEGESPYRFSAPYIKNDDAARLEPISDNNVSKRHQHFDQFDSNANVVSAKLYEGKRVSKQPPFVDITQSSVLAPRIAQQQYLQQAKVHYQEQEPKLIQQYQPVNQLKPGQKPLRLINYNFETDREIKRSNNSQQIKPATPIAKSHDFIPITETVSSVAADLELKHGAAQQHITGNKSEIENHKPLEYVQQGKRTRTRRPQTSDVIHPVGEVPRIPIMRIETRCSQRDAIATQFPRIVAISRTNVPISEAPKIVIATMRNKCEKSTSKAIDEISSKMETVNVSTLNEIPIHYLSEYKKVSITNATDVSSEKAVSGDMVREAVEINITETNVATHINDSEKSKKESPKKTLTETVHESTFSIKEELMSDKLLLEAQQITDLPTREFEAKNERNDKIPSIEIPDTGVITWANSQDLLPRENVSNVDKLNKTSLSVLTEVVSGDNEELLTFKNLQASTNSTESNEKSELALIADTKEMAPLKNERQIDDTQEKPQASNNINVSNDVTNEIMESEFTLVAITEEQTKFDNKEEKNEVRDEQQTHNIEVSTIRDENTKSEFALMAYTDEQVSHNNITLPVEINLEFVSDQLISANTTEGELKDENKTKTEYAESVELGYKELLSCENENPVDETQENRRTSEDIEASICVKYGNTNSMLALNTNVHELTSLTIEEHTNAAEEHPQTSTSTKHPTILTYGNENSKMTLTSNTEDVTFENKLHHNEDQMEAEVSIDIAVSPAVLNTIESEFAHAVNTEEQATFDYKMERNEVPEEQQAHTIDVSTNIMDGKEKLDLTLIAYTEEDASFKDEALPIELNFEFDSGLQISDNTNEVDESKTKTECAEYVELSSINKVQHLEILNQQHAKTETNVDYTFVVTEEHKEETYTFPNIRTSDSVNTEYMENSTKEVGSSATTFEISSNGEVGFGRSSSTGTIATIVSLDDNEQSMTYKLTANVDVSNLRTDAVVETVNLQNNEGLSINGNADVEITIETIVQEQTAHASASSLDANAAPSLDANAAPSNSQEATRADTKTLKPVKTKFIDSQGGVAARLAKFKQK